MAKILEEFRRALERNQVTFAMADNLQKWMRGGRRSPEDKQEAETLLSLHAQRRDAANRAALEARPTLPTPSAARPSSSPRPAQVGGQEPRGPGRPQPGRVENANAGGPEILGEAFHNPYTFLPFATRALQRHAPTPLTIDEVIDEVERHRFTGIIDIEVKLLSPLLTADPVPAREEAGHRTHDVLVIGNDVIVPATGVRGALRSLLAVLTGGTLGHVDEEAWLCQGRDARLGPAGPRSAGLPGQVFLAQVVRPGGVQRPGTVRLGETRLVKAEDLERVASRAGLGDLPRPRAGARIEYLWTDKDVTTVATNRSDRTPWQIKLSGRPVNRTGKREGMFLAGDVEIEDLPAALWAAYHGRNRHGDHPELHKGDLVWLEPQSGCTDIRKAADVKSIQWARWGREGERLLDVIDRDHPDVLPDSVNPDGLVDEVTDLFGQVPRDDLRKEVLRFRGSPEKEKPAPSFAARVRPGNLVFQDARALAAPTTLAPLQPPHPGCAAFYRQPDPADDLAVAADNVSNRGTPLRGYKVYRTTDERDSRAPWNYATQPVYGDDGTPKNPRQKVNKTCALLPETAPHGRLRITARALSKRELALLLASCAVDWRLGGGKPLGLGHCRVVSARVRELMDDGTLGEPQTMTRADARPARLPEPWAAELTQDPQLVERLGLWQSSQMPVDKLRYPRAVVENQNKKNRGGHVWFQRHVQPRKSAAEGEPPVGLQTLHLHPDGDLAKNAGKSSLRAQLLPVLDRNNPAGDVLYGHDLFAGHGPDWSEPQGKNGPTLFKKLEPFDPARHGRATDQTGGAQGQTRDTRRNDRDRGRGR